MEDGAGNPATKTIYIVVYDDVSPVIEGKNLYTTGYLNKLNVEVIQDSLSAYDDCDGDITLDIFMYLDDYSKNYNKVGEYNVVFRVIDSSGNSDDHIVKIKVIDNVAPIIYIDATVVKVYGSARITLNELVDILYKNNELNQDEGYSVEVIADHYSKNYNVPGNYTYQIRLSNNKHTLDKTFIINVNESEFVEFKPSENLEKNIDNTFKIGVLVIGTLFIFGSFTVYKRFH